MLGLSIITSASAGVWVHEPGAGYAQIAVAHQEAGRVWLPTGELVENTDPALLGTLSPLFDDGRYAATDVALYGEVGVVRHVELAASVPIRTAQNRWSLARGTYPDIVQRNAGFGDLAVTARAGAVTSGIAWSGAVTGRVPLYSNAPEALGIEAGNSDFEDDRVPLGQGTWDLELGGGIGWGSASAWALAEAALRVRNHGFSEVVPARLQLGVKPVTRLAAYLGLDLAASLGNGTAPNFYRDWLGKGPSAIDDQTALTVSAGVLVDVARGFGIVAAGSRVVAGIRFPRITAGSVGVSYTFASHRDSTHGDPP
ncbi:MAG: hypothetical protein ABMB14_14800 [Myxococcota bacterium]